MSISPIGSFHRAYCAKAILDSTLSIDRSLLNNCDEVEIDKVLNPDRIQSMISQVKDSKVSSESSFGESTSLNQLKELLFHFYSDTPLERISQLLNDFDKEIFGALCRLVWKTDGELFKDFESVEAQMKENPRFLLEIVDEVGRNPIEVLIKKMTDSPGRSLLQAFEELPGFEHHSSSLHVNRKLVIEQYYKLIALNLQGQELKDMVKKGDEKLNFEIAKIAAVQNGRDISKDIQSFEIADQEHRFEVAKIAATQSGYGVSQYIKNYALTNQKYLFEVAKIAAVQNATGVSDHMKDYALADQEHRFEVAKIAAARNGTAVSINIQSFELANQEHRFEVAKIAAAEDGYGVSRDIQNYGITSQEHLFEVAKIAAVQNGFETFSYLVNFQLPEDKAIIIQWICLFDVDMEPKAKEFLGAKSLLFKGIEWLGGSNDDLAVQKKRILYGYMDAYLPKDKVGGFSKTEELIKKLCCYRNVQLARSFITIFCHEVIKSSDYLETYKFVVQKDYLILPMILVVKWGKAKEETIPVTTLLNTFRYPLKDGVTGLLQTWLQTLLVIDQSPLPDERKLALITQVCSSFNALQVENPSQTKDAFSKVRHQQLKFTLDLIQALLTQGHFASLDRDFDTTTEEGKTKMTGELQALLMEKLKEDPFLDLEGIPDFSERYIKTLGSMRVPLAWKIYENKIQSLNDVSLKAEFNRFIRSVLEDTFSQERYKISSSHLQYLNDHHLGLYQKWQEPQEAIALSPIQATHIKEREFDFAKFFQDKQGHKHFEVNGQDQLPGFTVFLTKTIEQQKKMLADLPPSGAEELTLSIERICMKLCLHQEPIKPLLEELKRHLKTLHGDRLELLNDINGLSADFNRLQATQDLFSIDTDDWQDLFLSGTEVTDSCQRIDGDPGLNKCLLAYVMDGKNRMVAIKNSSGKVVARAIFRLLLDKTTKEPLLFLDQIYPSSCSGEIRLALNRHAQKRAEELECVLVIQNLDSEEYEDYPHSAESLGSCSPFEYEDAAQGVNNGEFTISGLIQVFKPPHKSG